MVLIKKVIICKDCLEAIDDDYLAYVWEEACRLQGLYKRRLTFCANDPETIECIKTLEHSGYITSTESSLNYLAILPNGLHEGLDREGNECLIYCVNPIHTDECND